MSAGILGGKKRWIFLFHLNFNTEQVSGKFSSLHFIAVLSMSCANVYRAFRDFYAWHHHFSRQKEISHHFSMTSSRKEVTEISPLMHTLVEKTIGFCSAYLPKCTVLLWRYRGTLLFFNISNHHLGSKYIWIPHSVIQPHYSLHCYIKESFTFPQQCSFSWQGNAIPLNIDTSSQNPMF